MDIMQYMENPFGKGISTGMLSIVKKSLDDQFKDLQGKMRVKWYSLGKQYLVAHVSVPSHTLDKIYYDVLVEFDTASVPDGQNLINKCSAQVFSNCMSFTYTYANVFNENGWLIKWTKNKYDKKVFKKDPVQRNPEKQNGYERSLYLAFKYLTTGGRNYKDRIQLNCIKAKNTMEITRNIKTAESMLEDYNRQKKIEDDARKRTSKPKKPAVATSTPQAHNGVKRTVKTTKVTSISKIKKTKKV